MKSQAVKRVVAGALAAVAVITAVTVTESQATPFPALQAPTDPPSSTLAKYHELSQQAEKLNEDYLKAQDDLKAKQADLDKANHDLDAAKQAGAKATDDVDRYRLDVDRFAGASFTSGVQLNKLSALLSGSSTQDFLDRSSALDVLASDKTTALDNLSNAEQNAQAVQAQADDAQKRAQQARDAAQQLTSDIQGKQQALRQQLDQIKATAENLTPAERAAMGDTGQAAPDIPAPGPAAAAAIAAAKSKLGTPYMWGATGPNSFDCSGLMLWAYHQAGVDLPRTAAEQATMGSPVSRDHLQPGDLVFYYSPISHVGMYLGAGLMIHAPTSGDVVKISPLESQYAGARRVA